MSDDVTDFDVPEDERDLAEELADLMAEYGEHAKECELCSSDLNEAFDALVEAYADNDDD